MTFIRDCSAGRMTIKSADLLLFFRMLGHELSSLPDSQILHDILLLSIHLFEITEGEDHLSWRGSERRVGECDRGAAAFPGVGGKNMLRRDLNLRSLSLRTAGRLMDHDLRIGKRHSLPLRAAGQRGSGCEA